MDEPIRLECPVPAVAVLGHQHGARRVLSRHHHSREWRSHDRLERDGCTGWLGRRGQPLLYGREQWPDGWIVVVRCAWGVDADRGGTGQRALGPPWVRPG